MIETPESRPSKCPSDLVRRRKSARRNQLESESNWLTRSVKSSLFHQKTAPEESGDRVAEAKASKTLQPGPREMCADEQLVKFGSYRSQSNSFEYSRVSERIGSFQDLTNSREDEKARRKCNGLTIFLSISSSSFFSRQRADSFDSMALRMVSRLISSSTASCVYSLSSTYAPYRTFSNSAR